MITDCGMNFSL